MSDSFDFSQFDFSGAMRDLSRGLLVKPILHNYLYDARFPDFDLPFRKHKMERDPDGWFHPSTHPTMPARALYQYLRHPKEFPVEKKQYMSTLAVTLGTAAHSLIETSLTDAGIRPAELQTCEMCPPKAKCSEAGVMDEELGERGHMDGILSFDGIPNVPKEKEICGLEFKCLAPETLISMADGSLRPAGEISPGDLILGWNEEAERCEPREVSHVWDNGIVPVWAVKTRAGREIGVTDEHPFLTHRGWVFAENLRPGDKVRVGWGSEWAETKEPSEESYFLGVMVGDGGLTSTGVMVTSADPAVTARLDGYVKGQGATLRHVSRYDYSITVGRKGRSMNPVREVLRREGLLGCGSREKFVPPSVWTGGPRAWSEFLSGYFDADGTVVTKGSYPHVLWTSVNRDLLTECQTLLAYLGVRSSVATINSKYRGYPHVSYRLLVRDRRAVSRVREVLNLTHSEKAARLADLEIPDLLVPGWKFQQGWDEVMSVREGIARPTVAIEVDGGTHITAGLVTHNTSHDEFGRLSKVEDLDTEAFRKKWPNYYAQVQRYNKMRGLNFTVVLMMEMIFPFTMREFHIPTNPAFNFEIDGKYRAVRQAVADSNPPTCCGAKGCISALPCGVIR